MDTLLISGGRVLMPDLDVTRGDVLVDRETGEIRDVGSDVDVDASEADAVLDAGDGLVIPGLVNAHTHVAMTLLRGYADDKPLDRWLQEDIWPVEATLEPDDVRAGARLGVLEMIRSGTTAFGDMYFHVDAIVDAIREAGLRARVGHGIVTVGKDDDAVAAELKEGIDVADEYDGVADGRVQTAVMPHSLTTVDQETLARAAEAAADLDVPLHYHANETQDEVEPVVDREGQRPLEYADDLGLVDDRAFLAHGVYLDDREIDLLAERDTAVVHCPAANMKLASGMARVQDLLDAGVPVGLGTDGPASNNDLDVFDEMNDAALLGKIAADDPEAVSAETVVRMATEGSARALGFDAGRIEPGRRADLAVVDLDVPHLTPPHDLVSHLVYAARGSDVRHTVCDGRVLMRNREVLTMDADAVCQQAAERARAVIDRAE